MEGKKEKPLAWRMTTRSGFRGKTKTFKREEERNRLREKRVKGVRAQKQEIKGGEKRRGGEA